MQLSKKSFGNENWPSLGAVEIFWGLFDSVFEGGEGVVRNAAGSGDAREPCSGHSDHTGRRRPLRVILRLLTVSLANAAHDVACR
jgi:hypothetical protein